MGLFQCNRAALARSQPVISISTRRAVRRTRRGNHESRFAGLMGTNEKPGGLVIHLISARHAVGLRLLLNLALIRRDLTLRPATFDHCLGR
jgi:hypothetical protein